MGFIRVICVLTILEAALRAIIEISAADSTGLAGTPVGGCSLGAFCSLFVDSDVRVFEFLDIVRWRTDCISFNSCRTAPNKFISTKRNSRNFP